MLPKWNMELGHNFSGPTNFFLYIHCKISRLSSWKTQYQNIQIISKVSNYIVKN